MKARKCVVLKAIMIGFILWGIYASLDCIALQDKMEDQKKLKRITKQEVLEERAREKGELERILPADLIDLQLKDAPLSKLLEMLESMYRIKFRIETNIDDLRVSLTVRNLSLPSVIKLIAEASNLDYRVRNDGTVGLYSSQNDSVSQERTKEQKEFKKELPEELVDLKLKDEPLSKLLDLLADVYNVKFNIEGNVDDIKISLDVKGASLRDILQIIKAQTSFKYRIRNDGVVLVYSLQPIIIVQEKTKEQKELEKRLPEELVTIKVKDEPISVLLWILGDQFGVKFSIETNVENKKVNLDVNKVPLSEVIHIITGISNLKYRVRDDGVIVIYTP